MTNDVRCPCCGHFLELEEEELPPSQYERDRQINVSTYLLSDEYLRNLVAIRLEPGLGIYGESVLQYFLIDRKFPINIMDVAPKQPWPKGQWRVLD
ncbi:MAG: hypothetical protein AAB875_03865 [Patescibacteria group bacterium]